MTKKLMAQGASLQKGYKPAWRCSIVFDTVGWQEFKKPSVSGYLSKLDNASVSDISISVRTNSAYNCISTGGINASYSAFIPFA